jgi:hypothetical protein
MRWDTIVLLVLGILGFMVEVIAIPLLAVIWSRIDGIQKTISATRETYSTKIELKEFGENLRRELSMMLQPLADELHALGDDGAISRIRHEVKNHGERLRGLELLHAEAVEREKRIESELIRRTEIRKGDA